MAKFIRREGKSERCRRLFHAEVRGVEEDAHEDTAEGAGNGDGHDPGDQQEGDSLEVDGLEGAVAETDADGGTGDAHGGGDGEGVLREDQDGDGGTHLHGATTARRVVGDLVAHDCCENLLAHSKTEQRGWNV